jgi:regulation of enolase protein 1 (concanavalin A-like superfamily)
MVNTPSTAANSFYVNVDTTPTDPVMIWDTAVTTGFVKQTVSWRGNTNTAGTPGAGQFTPKIFNLTQGTHQLIVLGREGGAQLSTITISPASVLPAPWQVIDIGGVAMTGSASNSAGIYAIAGSGNLSGSSDNFRFLFQSMTGDGDLRAQLTSLQNTSSSARAGVIVRETLTSGSRYAFMGISPDGTIYSQTRTATASSSSSTSSGVMTAPNIWARLVRSGNALLGYKSSDGAAWTLVSSNSIAMATNVYFGLAVASGSTNALSTANFTNVVAIP